MQIGIVTDTTSSLPRELVARYGIELVPYHVVRGSENLRDSFDIAPDEFAAYMLRLRQNDPLPTTSVPSPGEYLDAFRKLAERTHQIVVLTMTSKGSAAYQSCRAALEMLPEQLPGLDVRLVDTLQVAMALGWVVLEAARAALQGASLEAVIARAQQVARRAMMVQTADTLKYLYMGGRIGRAQHLVGSLLEIKPLIGMQDGVIAALGTARTRPRAYAKMVDLARQHIGKDTIVHAAFTYCGVPDQAAYLRELFTREINCAEVITTPLSPALAVHSGPGTVGVCLFSESNHG